MLSCCSLCGSARANHVSPSFIRLIHHYFPVSEGVQGRQGSLRRITAMALAQILLKSDVLPEPEEACFVLALRSAAPAQRAWAARIIF